MVDRAQAEDKPMVEKMSREDRVREAAYRRHLARGDGDGDEESDWLEAEKEVDAEDQK